MTDDLLSLQNDLLRELAQNHTTLRRPSADSNRSRWPLHPLWRALQADIATLPQTGLIAEVDSATPLDWRAYQQGKALHGFLKGEAAIRALQAGQDTPPSLDDVLGGIGEILRPHHDPHTWDGDIAKRMKGYELGQW